MGPFNCLLKRQTVKNKMKSIISLKALYYCLLLTIISVPLSAQVPSYIPTATISQNDTTICIGQSLTLSAITDTANQVCSSSLLPSNLQNGLVSYWPFCGNANDASGNGNNGNVNGATLTTDRFGNANSAYSFNGTTSYIDVQSGNTTSLNVIGDISFSFWIKTSQATTGVVLSFGDQVSSVGGYLAGLKEANAPAGILTCGVEYGTATDWETSLNTLNNNTWHNAVLTLKANTLSLYIDNVLNRQINNANAISSWNGARRIGVANYVLSGFFNGLIDDIGIWNRGLTSQEVQQLYTIGNPSYNWNTGNTTKSITVAPMQNSTYTITVTQNGQTASDSVKINVSKPSVLITATDSIFCSGSSVLLTASGAHTYLWNNGASTATTYATSTLQYQVIGMDTLGCKDTAVINTLVADTLTWTGTVDTNWHRPCNWSPAKVPSCCNTVIIPLTSNQPVVSNIAGCHDMVIYSTNGAKLKVDSAALLQIGQCIDSVTRLSCQTLPVVTTAPVTSNGASATGGGQVTYSGSSTVTSRGVCWSINHNPTLADSKTIDGLGLGIFASNITGLQVNTVYYIRAYATNSTGTVYGSEVNDSTYLSLGQSYQGGIIAYLDGSGLHGLIVSDIEYTGLWGCVGLGGGSYSDNDGYANTSAAFNGCNYGNVAIAVSWNLTLNGYSDWYLPAKNQLLTIYQNLFSQGILSMSGRYWASTAYSTNWAWWLNTNGTWGAGDMQGGYLYFRPARNF